jgi:hypothetical protein
LAPVITSTPPRNSFARIVLPASRLRAGAINSARTGDSSISGSMRCFELRFAMSTVGDTAIIGPGAWWMT